MQCQCHSDIGRAHHQQDGSHLTIVRVILKEDAIKRDGGVDIDGLVQERRNSSALAMELRLSCTNTSIYARC